MKCVRTVSLLGFWLVFGNLIANNAFPQATRFLGTGLSSSSSVEITTTRAAPVTGNMPAPVYAGVFASDARYHPAASVGGFLASRRTQDDFAKRHVVPPGLRSSGIRARDDIAPPAHVVATVQPHSLLAGALNSLVGAVYGPPQVLQSIYQITTDSSGRLVLSDPALQAIHVLDPKGRRSFSLLGGPGRYLHQPAGVAIDGDDNIYVADSERGMVLVYDQEGRFLRYIGNFHGENWYQYPTGIVIDRTGSCTWLTVRET